MTAVIRAWGRWRVAPIYAVFENPADAWVVAAASARALREVKTTPGAVATLPTWAVEEYVQEEIEVSTTSFFEEGLSNTWDNWRVPRWVESLQSIKPAEDGTVLLDADQAVALVDCLVTVLEGVEELEGAGEAAVMLRTALVQIESQCGLWAEFWGGDPKQYSIRVNMEGEFGNYRVRHQGETLALVDTLAEAYKVPYQGARS